MPDAMTDGRPWPRISIVVPSYNQGRLIEESLRSLLLQGYPDLEIILIDGGSSDGTVAVIEKYRPWLRHASSERDRGQSHALNKGFAASTGSILGWLNSDDILLPQAFQTVSQSSALVSERPAFMAGRSAHRDAVLEKTLYEVTDLPRCTTDLFAYPDGLYLPQPSVFFTRSAWQAAGDITEDLHYAMDLDYWLRLSAIADVQVTDATLSWMRQHDEAKTWRDEQKVIVDVETVLDRHRDLVTPAVFARAMRSCSRRSSLACVRSARAASSAGKRSQALRELARSIAASPRILLHRAFLGVLIRLCLPAVVQRMILTEP